MIPGETVRFACGDCQDVFDLCVAPLAEWAEVYHPEEADDTLTFEPVLCPFCGSSEVRSIHDRAIVPPSA